MLRLPKGWARYDANLVAQTECNSKMALHSSKVAKNAQNYDDPSHYANSIQQVALNILNDNNTVSIDNDKCNDNHNTYY